eukprot:g7604.t1
MFNLFELYTSVTWLGGFNKVSIDSKWHRIAYVLCRATKKQKQAAKSAKMCFKENLLAFAERLEALSESYHEQNGVPQGPCLKRMKLETCSGPRLRSRSDRRPSYPVRPRRSVQWSLRTSFDVLTYLPLPKQSCNEAIKCITPLRGSFRRNPLPTTQQLDELIDLVPGDVLRSALLWLRRFAQNPLERMDFVEETLHFRYSSELLHMRQKLNHSFKRESTHSILIKHTQTESEDEQSRESDEDAKDIDVRHGPQFQAEIPPYTPLLNQSPSRRWNTTPITLKDRPNRKQARWSREKVLGSREMRLEWVDRCNDSLRVSLGGASESLGMRFMGNRVRNSWTTEQECLFASGFALHGRSFDEIRDAFLPEKTNEDLVIYYYNIWKQCRTPAAAEWYQEKRQKILDQQKADQQRQLEIKTRNRLQAAEGRQRRMDKKQQKKLEDALTWVRSLAKNPENNRSVRGHLFYASVQRMASLYRDGTIQLPP